MFYPASFLDTFFKLKKCYNCDPCYIVHAGVNLSVPGMNVVYCSSTTENNILWNKCFTFSDMAHFSCFLHYEHFLKQN